MKSVKNNMELTTFDEHLEKRYGLTIPGQSVPPIPEQSVPPIPGEGVPLF